MTGRYTRPRAVDIDAAASMLPSLKPEGNRARGDGRDRDGSGPGFSPNCYPICYALGRGRS